MFHPQLSLSPICPIYPYSHHHHHHLHSIHFLRRRINHLPSSTYKTRVFPHQQLFPIFKDYNNNTTTVLAASASVLHSLDFTNPNSYQSHVSILHSCRKLYLPHHLGFQIHAHMLLSGVCPVDDVFLASQLLEFYCKFGSIRDARLLLDRMPIRNVFCWTSLLGMCCDSGHFQETIDMFYALIGDQKGSGEGVRPAHFVFPKVFKACAELKNYKVGKDVYDYMIAIGFEGNNCVKRSYLDMFVKCGKMDVARHLFQHMGSKDVVMWNIMVSGYISKRDFKRALRCVSDMELAGVLPDRVTWNTILAGHAQVGQFSEASKYLSDIRGSGELEPNVVSWTALITGNEQNGFSSRALGIFRKMVLAGVKPNSTTIASVGPPDPLHG